MWEWEDAVIVIHGVDSLQLKNRLQRLGVGKKQEKYQNTVITIRSPLQWILCTVSYMLTKVYKQNVPYHKDTTCNNCQLIAINYGPNFAFIYTFKRYYYHHWIMYFNKDFYSRLCNYFYIFILNMDLTLMCRCLCRNKPLNLNCSSYHLRP